ncbi:hypothetical protein CE91St46_27820 [Eubacteriales bacterium]|nr:hypothetical protein [Faecalicatena sp. BF-R-105]GKH51671.1 hypothetical protein CE91St46_27820 [Eubacteriales bacterium]GKH64390.1 hypothetical protein CE91St47_28590 [Eubacteriales bacterium]
MLRPYMDRGRIGMFLLAQLAGEDRVALAKDSGLTCLHVGANTGDGKDSIKAVKMVKASGLVCRYSLLRLIADVSAIDRKASGEDLLRKTAGKLK